MSSIYRARKAALLLRMMCKIKNIAAKKISAVTLHNVEHMEVFSFIPYSLLLSQIYLFFNVIHVKCIVFFFCFSSRNNYLFIYNLK